jgi:ABC-type Mn2+/Zn2+ transport system permease subunit
VPVGALLGLLIVLIVLAMIASLQAVGVMLSLGLMVLPAATVYLLSDQYGLLPWAGGLLGSVGALAGLGISYFLDMPSGPVIIMLLGMIFLTAYLFSPRYGALVSRFHRRHLHEESLERWRKGSNKPQS